ncbi:MAG: hypothetical protein R6V19_00255, partial [Armatimonadota bacterium]
GILALIIVAVWWWRRRLRDEAPEAAPLSFHEQALADLKTLEHDNPLNDRDFKRYYSRLGDILRRWLEERSEVRAMESTTALIRYDLRKTHFPPEWQGELIELLSRADLAKFARSNPSEQTAREDLDVARDLIERQAPPAPDTDEGEQREVA